jgi:hypothetical protein
MQDARKRAVIVAEYQEASAEDSQQQTTEHSRDDGMDI